MKDLPQTDFGRLPERLLLSVRTKSLDENFVTWKLRQLLFLYSWFNAFSILSLLSTFLVSKGLLCLYDKQINTWLLVDINFSLLVFNSASHSSAKLTRELSSWTLEENSISAWAIYSSLCIFIAEHEEDRKYCFYNSRLTDAKSKLPLSLNQQLSTWKFTRCDSPQYPLKAFDAWSTFFYDWTYLLRELARKIDRMGRKTR